MPVASHGPATVFGRARATPPDPVVPPSGDLTERLREQTRMGLVDAKNHVERLPPTGPDRLRNG